MTREEALYRVKGYLTDIIPIEDYSEVEEIIKALEQPKMIDTYTNEGCPTIYSDTELPSTQPECSCKTCRYVDRFSSEVFLCRRLKKTERVQPDFWCRKWIGNRADELISRQQAIDALKICDNNESGINCHKCPLRDERWDGAWEDDETNCYTKLMRDSAKLLELPPAEPDLPIKEKCAYCPHCGNCDVNDDLSIAQPELQNARIFQEIVVEYPSYNTYPEYEGKPYFSIKYTENGQDFIGYGTYKPEVLSQYLKEYFMPSTVVQKYKR